MPVFVEEAQQGLWWQMKSTVLTHQLEGFCLLKARLEVSIRDVDTRGLNIVRKMKCPQSHRAQGVIRELLSLPRTATRRTQTCCQLFFSFGWLVCFSEAAGVPW